MIIYNHRIQIGKRHALRRVLFKCEDIMGGNKKKLKSITINFSSLQDLDDLISLDLSAGDHLTICGIKRGSLVNVTYKLFRKQALDSEILKEEYES